MGAFKQGASVTLAAHSDQLAEAASRAWVDERLKDAMRRAGGLDAAALEDALAGARAAAAAADRAKVGRGGGGRAGQEAFIWGAIGPLSSVPNCA